MHSQQTPHRQMNQNMLHLDPSLFFLSNSNASPPPPPPPPPPPHKYYSNLQFLTPLNPQSFAIQFEQQFHKDEVDHCIKSQNEKLRILLQEQRKQQLVELLKKVESEALYALSQKDEQIAQAAKKKAELEEFLRRLEAENQSWRRVAEQNEAMAMSLHNTLEQIKERASYGMRVEDAESCCDENMCMEEELEENKLCNGGVGVGETEQIAKRTMICKCCNSRSSCFMFLPCRHLCSCKTCEPLLQACPVCGMPKKSSIETLIF